MSKAHSSNKAVARLPLKKHRISQFCACFMGTYQAEQLLVFPLSVVARNGDSVWQVVGESIDGIIDDDCLGKVTPKPVQVLREHV